MKGLSETRVRAFTRIELLVILFVFVLMAYRLFLKTNPPSLIPTGRDLRMLWSGLILQPERGN